MSNNDEAVRLTKKFGRYEDQYRAEFRLCKFTPDELAALIAEVRQRALEEAAGVCDERADRAGGLIQSALEDAAATIRAMKEEGK